MSVSSAELLKKPFSSPESVLVQRILEAGDQGNFLFAWRRERRSKEWYCVIMLAVAVDNERSVPTSRVVKLLIGV